MVCQQLRRPRDWSASDVALLEAVAREAGTALGHAKAFQHERQVVARLQELDRAKGTFVSSVSHELRTPLTSIVGYLELLADGDPLSAEQAEVVEVIGHNARRLLSLIEDLLTLSRVESAAPSLRLAPTPLGPLVEAACRTVRPDLAAKSLRLEVEVEDTVVPCDPGQIERVLVNLLGNAVKFTPDGGRVRVRAARTAGQVTVAVTDTGVGIPPEEQARLFSPFFRSAAAQRLALQGSGLGLAIVKSIVEEHGGSVRVDSGPGAGTTVSFTLPLDRLVTAAGSAPGGGDRS